MQVEDMGKFPIGVCQLVDRRGGNRSSGVYRGGLKTLQYSTAIGAAK